MKNKFLQFIILLICCFTTGAQATNNEKTSFRYPFSQGDKKWKEFKNPQDRIVALQIPEDVLTKISTEELISCCLDFPYLSDAVFFDDINDGFNSLVSEFNGLRELQKREDRIDALIKTFGLISLDKMYLGDKTTIEIGYNSLKIYILAYMIGHENVIGELTNKQRNNLLNFIEDYTKTLLLYPSFQNTLGNLAIAELKYTLQGSRNRYISGDYYSTTIYTPNGSPVLAWNLYQNELDEVDKAQLAYSAVYNYGATIISEATKTYNCHGYAWNVAEGGDSVWICLNSVTDENIYWTDGSYVEVDESLATKVSYDENTANHSAVRITHNVYRSKWGAGPLVEHAPNSCPYNTTMPKKFYRKAIPTPTPSISGATLLWNYGEYSVSNLSNYETVSWSLFGSNASNFVLQNNSPSANQCTITRKFGESFVDTTNVVLTAQIKHNDSIVAIISKYLITPHISGPTEPCGSNVYRVANLPVGNTVSWSVSPAVFNPPLNPFIVYNSPQQNQCTINNSATYAWGTNLYAYIKNAEGDTISTLVKPIRNTFDLTFSQMGMTINGVTYPSIPETSVESDETIIVNHRCRVSLYSPYFENMTLTHTGATPLFFDTFNGNLSFRFSTVTTTQHMYIYGTDGCKVINLHVQVTPNSNIPTPMLEINPIGDGFEILLSYDGDEEAVRDMVAHLQDIEWNLNIANAMSGEKVQSLRVKGPRTIISTIGKKPGVYVLQAIVDGQECSEKITIK